MRLFRRTVGGSPDHVGREAAARTIDEFIHRAEMDRAIGEAILQGVVPTAVSGVAAAGHRAVIPNVRKAIAASDRIVKEHRIRAERALTTEGQRAEMFGRYTAVVFVIEWLARARAIYGFRIASPGKAVVNGIRGGR